MIPASFDYARPETLSQAIGLLAADPEAKLLAGGHSLIPALKLRLAQPSKLVDLGAIADLQFVAEADGLIHVGAMTTHHQIETSELLRERCPLLAAAAASIGDVQVRNRGTIGGSIVHADPAADYPAALLALEAKVKIVGPSGEKTMTYENFLLEAYMTALEPGEIVSEIQLPAEDGASAYRTIVQPASGYAIVGVAVRVKTEGGTATRVRVGVTGLASKAFRARATEQALETRELTAELIAAAAAHAADGVEPLSDLHAAADYRAHLARVLVRRAFEQACDL